MTDLEERYRRHGTDDWQRWGSAQEHHRYAVPVGSRERRRCGCGCKRRATHRGMANGVALTSGCELSIRRWVKDPNAYYVARRKP